jgi:hypothetical protein
MALLDGRFAGPRALRTMPLLMVSEPHFPQSAALARLIAQVLGPGWFPSIIIPSNAR